MFIMTINGWRRIQSKDVIASPTPQPAHTLQGWKERGYKSYLGWIHNDYSMIDPTQDF